MLNAFLKRDWKLLVRSADDRLQQLRESYIFQETHLRKYTGEEDSKSHWRKQR